MPRLYSRLLFIATLVLCLGAGTDPDGRLYLPSADPVADVQEALGRADDSDRRLLVVLGANWCHDSRALAARLHSPPLAEVIQQHYELVFVDVGFYEKGREVTQQFGVAHFYATPTVLIIDPSSEALVNDEDRHIWSNAYNVDMPSSVEYFEKWANNDSVADPVTESTQLRQLYAEIDQFEQQLADRVAAGYAVVGPMLEATVAGDEPEEFDASWDELRDFRMAIPEAIRELRDEAQRRVSAGDEDIRLVFPEYPLLSWESGQVNYDAEREALVAELREYSQLSEAYGAPPISESILDVIGRVARHEFVPESQKPHAYANRPLPIGADQTISQPYIVALMTDLLALNTDQTVLEIGTGSGYQAAVLSELAGEVYTIEIIDMLGRRAARDLERLGYDNVTVRVGDGYAGWPEHAPFDAIIVTAAPDKVPQPLIDQLAVGGRMVIPVGPQHDLQVLQRLTKEADGGVTIENITAVRFVPFTRDSEKE